MTALATAPGIARSSPLRQFSLAIKLLDDHWEQRRPNRHAMVVAYEADVVSRWRKTHPEARRKKILYQTLWKKERSWCEPILAEWQPRANALSAQQDAQKDRLEGLLRRLAARIPLSPSDGVWTRIDRIHASTYRSTGSGHEYARVAAEMQADKARHHGIPVQLVEFDEPVEERCHLTGWCVWVALGPIETRVLEYKEGEPMAAKQWIDRCWKRGVNPYVYNPFLA